MAGRVNDPRFPPGVFGHVQQSLANRITRRPAARLLRGVFVTSTSLVPQPAPVVATGAAAPPVPVGKAIPADTLSLAEGLRTGHFFRICKDEFTLASVRDFGKRSVELVDEEVTRLLTEMQQAGYSRINRRDLEDAINLVAKDDSYDSMQDWLTQLPPWDRKPRVATFLPVYFGTKRNSFTNPSYS